MGNTLEGSSGRADVMIIGGGPTGIGAAYRLNQHGNESWILLDAEKQPGGLAGSIKTHEGFRFDHGYKTFFSRYDYLDRLLEECYAGSQRKLVEKTRDNYVYVKGRMVRFPLQNNLSGLPEKEQIDCALDMVKTRIVNRKPRQNKEEGKALDIGLPEEENAAQESQDITSEREPSTQNSDESTIDAAPSQATEQTDVALEERVERQSLDDYLIRNWGETLCNILFRPYIFKSFAYPTSKLSADWAEYKIPPSEIGNDIERLINDEQSDPGLDSDSSSLYPYRGGLVALWKNIIRKLPKDNVRFKSEITDLDIEEKVVRTKDGLEIRYDTLISTMPITSLLDLAGRSDLAESLVYSSLHIVCLGIRGTSPHKDITGCIYFPESDCVFHRACVFSSFDPDSVPHKDEEIATMRLADETVGGGQVGSNQKGPYWSLILEVSGGPLKTVNEETIMHESIRDACTVGLLRSDDEIVSIHMTEMTHGQPLPTPDWEEKTGEALEWLQSKSIYSRGRFGAFRYHIGDLDHCFIQGVEAVDNILTGAPERCVFSSAKDVDCRGNRKIHEPAFHLGTFGEPNGQAINAGAVRNAITREPAGSSSSSYTSTASPSTRSRTSSHQDDASQLSDTETTSSV